MSKSFGIDDAQKFVDEHYHDNQDVVIGARIDCIKLSDGEMFSVTYRRKPYVPLNASVLSSLETNVAIQKTVDEVRAIKNFK